jgi:hypothetical protein
VECGRVDLRCAHDDGGLHHLDPLATTHTHTHRFYITGLVLEIINVLACVAVMVKITRRRRRGGPGRANNNSSMAQLIDDLVLLLAAYHLVFGIVFGIGVYAAYLSPADTPLGSVAFELVRRSSID